MALPLSNSTVDGEEEAIHASDAAAYTQLPADHLSESSENSYGPSDDLTYDTPDVFSAHDNGSSVALTGGCPSYQNGGSVDDVDGRGNRALTLNNISRHMDNQAALHNNSGASHSNGLHIDVQTETQDSDLFYRNGGHGLPINQIQDQTVDNHGAPHGGHVININGMEIHVYGHLSGLQLFAPSHHPDASHNDDDDIGDVDERERQWQEDTAMFRANAAEEARRLAPLAPERCQAIKEAMQSISLGGYRPEWADKVPEEQWLNRLRRK